MVVHIASFAFAGINVVDVDIQVQIANGIPSFTILGSSDRTISDAKERIKAALLSLGLALPSKRIVVNLAPADLLKEGSHFDLAIACALLVSFGVLDQRELLEYVILGELGLDSHVLPVPGVLPAAVGALSQNRGIICPYINGVEAAWSGNPRIIAPSNLLELVNHFKGTQVLSLPSPGIDNSAVAYQDLADVVGQQVAKRAIEIAASGGHHMIMVGPPGAGKSMLASRLPGILPELTTEEILECSMVSSIAGLINNGQLTRKRPFRAPHHSCSVAAMVGGGIGRRIRPGEVSLAHNGVLFLDELPEFDSDVIESLRQPIETGKIVISRSGAHITYPASFQLIAAMNPCRSGYVDDPSRACHRAPRCAVEYQRKVSGPIMDRFDLHIEVSSPDINTIQTERKTRSCDVAARVREARRRQYVRYSMDGITRNSQLDGELLVKYVIDPSKDAVNFLNEATGKLKISMRGYHRILRVARTIADLSGQEYVIKDHVAEALSYRRFH